MNSNDEAAFREFVASRSMALIRTAYVLTGDQQDAEDLVQTALAKLARRWRRVEDPERYARRILYNEQVSTWRRRRVREDSMPDPPDRQVADPSNRVTDRLDIERALARLGPRQRAVIVLRYYEDLPEDQVAELLGCSVGTVGSQLSRGLARMRELAPELSDAFEPATTTTSSPTSPGMPEGAMP